MTPVFVVTASELIGGVIVALIFIVLLILWAIEAIKHAMCKHDAGVWETRACDAICSKCGKNLGFIGALDNKGRAK